jgi:hypothetical protein
MEGENKDIYFFLEKISHRRRMNSNYLINTFIKYIKKYIIILFYVCEK